MVDWRKRIVDRLTKAADSLRRVPVWGRRSYDLIIHFPSDFWQLLVWILHSPVGLKRFADVMEKVGAAILAIGLFQGELSAFPYGLICLYTCFRIIQQQEQKK